MLRSEPNPPAAELRPQLLPRVELARVIVSAEAALLAIVGVQSVFAPPLDPLQLSLGLVAAAVLGWGVWRIGQDAPPAARPFADDTQWVPWDWTDVVLFFPGAFVVGAFLINITVHIAQPLTSGLDSEVSTAVQSFVAQAAYYVGALFNLWVLVWLRRGGTLSHLGFRRFQWWWVPVAVAGAVGTLLIAGYLQELMQQSFPSLPNTQCTAVRHDYGHILALAIIVTCFIAPLAEETVFRGFLYGWLRKASPALIAIPASAAVFSAVHNVWLLAVPLFFVGCVLALFYQASRSIFPSVIVHALFNLPGIISILYATSC
ncbi:MAG TPA: CPBP family intramembrane glutamic endopeptidase [Candidatus Dormibacteraeota bacterium]|nr:CPBP family intramembrane glutamic endopeptidase [Candidatus Dormibacteraeota bacterium]